MRFIENSDKFDLHIFVTGMHMHSQYGNTYREIIKDGYKNVYLFINQTPGMGNSMDVIFANTISGFSGYINELKPDLVVVHGDRLEALAGVIVAATNNIYAAHIEGGEISGTIDESIRHAVTKMAQSLNYSQGYLQSIYKKQTGDTILEALTQIRMRYAARFLLDPNLTITSISQRVGYSNPSYFGEQFTKIYGIKPHQYRKNHIK